MKTSEYEKIQSNTKLDNAQKRWRFCAIIWPPLCLFFAVMILCDSERSIDERIANTAFTLIPLIFFAIGMSIRHRLLKEQKYATAFTNAVVVSDGLRIRTGKRNFFPEFEFQANGVTYKVKYSAGYSFRIVSEGKSIELYYNPSNPKQFYVPAIQKHDNRLSLLLCGVGIVWPVLGLFAPLIQASFFKLLNG